MPLSVPDKPQREMIFEKNLRIRSLHSELDRVQKQLRSFPGAPNHRESPRGFLYDLLMNRMSQIIIELDKLEG
jgi:hypothetical protein